MRIEKELKQYHKKLDKVLEKRDIKGLMKLGKDYGNPCPNELVAEVTMHKLTIARRKYLKVDTVMESIVWLRLRGYSLSLES